MAHGDAREGKWKGNWRKEWVASTLHTTSEHGVSGITTADAHTSAVSSRLNWRLRQFKWTIRFAERRNLVSARVPSHFRRSLLIALGTARPYSSVPIPNSLAVILSHTVIDAASSCPSQGLWSGVSLASVSPDIVQYSLVLISFYCGSNLTL